VEHIYDFMLFTSQTRNMTRVAMGKGFLWYFDGFYFWYGYGAVCPSAGRG
jgi:hypothetical protein